MMTIKFFSHVAPINSYIVISSSVLQSSKTFWSSEKASGLMVLMCMLTSHVHVPTWVNSKFLVLGQGPDKKAKLSENNASLQLSNTGEWNEFKWLLQREILAILIKNDINKMVTTKLNHWELSSTTNLKTVTIKWKTTVFYLSTRYS